MNIIDLIWQICITEFLAVFGAFARFLNQKEKISVKLTNIISGCLIAAFAGMLVYFASQYFEFDQNLGFLLAGICGWSGPQILDSISSMVLKKAGIGIEPKE